MRECWICSQPHMSVRRVRTRTGELLRVVVPRRQYRDLPDCGHREPGLIAYWRAQDGAQRIAAPSEVLTRPKPLERATEPPLPKSGYRLAVTREDAFGQRRG